MKALQVTLIALLLATACSKNHEPDGENDQTSTDQNVVVLTALQKQNANITTGNYEEGMVSSAIKATGRMEAPPQNITIISTPFGGFIKSTDLLPGMKVSKGQVVAQLEHPDFIQVQQDYLDLKSQLEFLETEYKRQEDLFKENINAQKTFQQAKANYLSTKAKVDGMRAKLKLMRLDMAAIERGDFSAVISLFSTIEGYVTEVKVNLGQYVNPNDVIVTIVNTHHLHVELKVFEKDIPHIRNGQSINFSLMGDSTKRKATVYLTGRAIEPDRSITIHGHLLKEEPDLLPGMYVNAEIETEFRKARLLPEEAIVKFEGKSYIFISEKGNFKMIPVIVGIRTRGLTEIIPPENFDWNNQFVLTGAYSLLSVLKNSEPEF